MEDARWTNCSKTEDEASQSRSGREDGEGASQLQSDIEDEPYLQLLNEGDDDDILSASSDADSQSDDQQEQEAPKPKKRCTTASFIHSQQADGSLAAVHRFFGNLYLQDPSKCLSRERLKKYEELKPAILELERRTEHPSATSFDYLEYFKTFQEQETQLWQNLGISRLKEELVPASGIFATARLAHRLHNPSFTTTTPHKGSTADPNSPCTALVMANGWSDKTIMMDHTVRREVNDPFRYYPEEILACHERHLTTIREQMNAPVEVIYGVPTWKRNLKYLAGLLEPFDLWGDYQGIRLYLEWDSAQNVNLRRLNRFIIAAWHPQNLTRAWANNYKTAQDKLLELAYKLASVHFEPCFFENHAWQDTIKRIPRGIIAENKSLEHQSRLDLQATHAKLVNDADAGIRNRSKQLHARLTSLVEKSLDTRSENPTVKGQFTRPPLSPFASKAILEIRKAKTDISHLIYNNDEASDFLPSQVECLCITCWGDAILGNQNGTIGIDCKPRWTKTEPVKYLERRLGCQNCGKQQRLVPISDIPSISDGAFKDFIELNSDLDQGAQLKVLQNLTPSSRVYRWQKPSSKALAAPPAPKKKAGNPHLIVSEHLDSGEGRKSVKTKCNHCHHDGPEDYHPQHIIGSEIYLARHTTSCKSKQCVKHNRHWIPRDRAIAYMTQATFTKKRKLPHAELCAKPKRGHRQNK